jgi:hypothetical protein
VRLADLDPEALRVVEDLIIGDAFASLSTPAADSSLRMIAERDDTAGRS